jgi:hypothetical protein
VSVDPWRCRHDAWIVYKNGQLICETAPNPGPIWKAKSTRSSSSFIDNIKQKLLEIYDVIQDMVIDAVMVDFWGIFITDLISWFIIVPFLAVLFSPAVSMLMAFITGGGPERLLEH